MLARGSSIPGWKGRGSDALHGPGLQQFSVCGAIFGCDRNIESDAELTRDPLGVGCIPAFLSRDLLEEVVDRPAISSSGVLDITPPPFAGATYQFQ
jgi:hypothetical protein